MNTMTHRLHFATALATTLLWGGAALAQTPKVVHVAGKLTDANGDAFDLGEKDSFALCRCGASDNRPFCDGNHRDCHDGHHQRQHAEQQQRHPDPRSQPASTPLGAPGLTEAGR